MPEVEIVPPVATSTLVAHRGAIYIGRQDLRDLPVPEATATHRPVPHHEVVQAVIESLNYRKINVVRDDYAVTPDGMRMFAALVIDVEGEGIRLALGIRNSHDKSVALALTIGYRVFVCDNLAFHGDFTPAIRKHSKHLDIVSVIDGAIGKMQRQFDPLRRQVDVWRGYELSDAAARHVIYRAFIEEEVSLPKKLGKAVHRHYFTPEYDEFKARSLWSLQNAFTSALKELDPAAQFQGAAKLAPFMQRVSHDGILTNPVVEVLQ